MLTNTFIHVPGVGIKTERTIWRQGGITWDDFLSKHRSVEIGSELKGKILETIEKSVNSLKDRDTQFFSNLIPRSEIWRVYQEFKGKVLFLDIETDGGFGGNAITMIGVYDGKYYKNFLKGYNLEYAQEFLMRSELLVTFNGARFDLPLICDLFKDLQQKSLHIDVMNPLRRLGYKGGLKKVEVDIGIKRSIETRGLDGWDAVRLWREYRHGKNSSLDLLIKYNREDVENLKPIMEFAYSRLHEETFSRYVRLDQG